MLAVTTNRGATEVIVIAAARAAQGPAAPAVSVVISVEVQAAAVVIVRAVLVSKAARVAMTVPHALKSRAPWPCPPG